MEPIAQDYPRKRARTKRSNDGLWTPGMGEPSASSTAIVYPASSTHSSPFASPSPRKQQTSSLKSFIRIYGPAVSLEVTRSHTPLRLRSRAMPVELDSSDLSNASQDSAPPKPPASQHKTPPSPTNAASANRASSQPAAANSSPKAKAVVHDPSSPFWSNAGGIFQPDAQNPIAVSTADAQALQPLVNPIDHNPLAKTPAFSGISALVFDPSENQPTPTVNSAMTVPPSPSATPRRAPALSALLPASSAAAPQPTRALPSVSSLPRTVTETRATIVTSSSLLLTTTLVSASQSSISSSSSASQSSSSSSSSTSSVSPASASSTNFLTTLGSSPVNITITVLVCIGILALIIAFLFIFIRRCQRRRKRRRLGDILGSEFGSPGGGGGGIGGGSGMSEWATPGPGWTEKYYGEQIGGRMVGLGTGTRGSSAGGHGGADELEFWQRDGIVGTGMGMEGGYGVARTLSQDRRTSEWANYRGRGAVNEFDRRPSWEEGPEEGGLAEHTHVLGYDNRAYAVPAPPPTATVRDRPETDFTIDRLALPVSSTRPRPVQQPSYSSYASESMYPVDEVGDIEAEKKELSDTMSALNLGGHRNERDTTTSPAGQTSWRDSLDWVMGSAADLIGSKLLARGGSADTLVASPQAKKVVDGDDRFTQRPPSIRIPRVSDDPRTISDQFTPLSATYGDRFLDPARAASGPVTLSRQSSMISFTSSANFATTQQEQGAFAQSARSRLFDAALAKHAQDEDEMEVLDDIAAAMMSRQTTNVTATSDMLPPPPPPEIPFPRFDTTPLSTSRRYIDSPSEMTCTPSAASTSSSFTYRPTPPPPQHDDHYLETTPSLEMNPRSSSTSSMGTNQSFDAFGRESMTPREYNERSTRTNSRRSRKKGISAAMQARESMSSISTFNDQDSVAWEKTRDLVGERRRRSEEFEESLV